MSGANYAHCDFEPCLKLSGSTKVFYDADTDIPPGTVIMHGECAKAAIAAAEQRGYQRAIDALRDGDLDGWVSEHRPKTRGPLPLPVLRALLADALEALATQPTTEDQ